ncbi:antichymotrypsin-2-like [Scaptodrosophila lebanonensis]|uniref:Antichymotrypsin-2-like n=1 Tax=Drosophila lebanonensis TaxID=7225 RepID=A0A6J2UAE4_DROLE|nr:antichymotrypsin-2-like [Scaptodrosophila lebanonensis]
MRSTASPLFILVLLILVQICVGLRLPPQINSLSSGHHLEEGQNLIISPASAVLSLVALYLCSSGKLNEQLRNLLWLSESENDVRDTFKSILHDHTNRGFELLLANKIYLSSAHPVLPSFRELLTSTLNANVDNIDFKDSEAATDNINQWVALQTKNKVLNLIQNVPPKTAFIFVNALHLRATWDQPFNRNRTSEKKFHMTHTKTVNVNMMHLEAEVPYGHLSAIEAEVLQLRFRNSCLSMYILLPDRLEDLQKLVKRMSQFDAMSLPKHLVNTRMSITIPKFNIDSSHNLIPPLASLGLTDIFVSHRYPKLTSSTVPIKVDQIHQKAVIKVNEIGVEASAATGIVTKHPVAIECKKFFVANRPFAFYIQDKNIVYFHGFVQGFPTRNGHSSQTTEELRRKNSLLKAAGDND